MIADDGSVRDPRHLQQIVDAIAGPKPDLMVRFVEHAKRDHKAEQEQQERIDAGSGEVARPYFKSTVYIDKRHKGQKDHMSKPATQEDKRNFPNEWAAFQAAQEQPAKHAIALLPGNSVCTQAIFDHLRIEYIEDFLVFTEEHPEILDIFNELRPMLEVAKRWRTFMKPRLKLIEGELKNANHQGA
jgi:hypothetical protein